MAKGRKVGPGSFLKASPAKFIGAVVGGISNIVAGNAAMGRAEDLQGDARTELNKQRAAYEGLDTSNLAANVVNPYANIQTQFENTFEDLTVNQQQAQFQAQQGAQQRSNILESMRGAAGGSGVAALAQAMANQSQLATQQTSASIGQQEAANQRAMAQGAAQVQAREAAAQQQIAQGEGARQAQVLAGAQAARGLEYDKTTNLFGMASGELAAANQAVEAARAQKQQGVSDLIGGVAGGLTSAVTGGLLGSFGKKGGTGVTATADNPYGFDPLSGIGNTIGKPK